MSLHFRFRYALAFLLLSLFVHELHELAHLAVGGAVCGCYGPREFNEWQLCASCARPSYTWFSSIAGPLFSYACMWSGLFGLRSSHPNRQALALSLLFAGLPFARLFTTLMNGGDELTLMRHLFAGSPSLPLYRGLVTALVAALTLTPIIGACRRIRNCRTWLWLTGFLLGPMVFQLVYLFQGMNALLQRGVLTQPWAVGTPALIWLHTGVVVALLALTHRYLFLINGSTPSVRLPGLVPAAV